MRSLLFFASAVLLGCPKPAELPAPEEPPLATALRLAHRDDPRVGFADEAGYFVPTSHPLIDAALAEPMAVPVTVDALGAALDEVAGPLPRPPTRFRKGDVPGPGEPAAILRALRPFSPAGDRAPAGAAPDDSGFVPALPPPSELLASERGQLLTQHLPTPFVAALTELVVAVEAAEAAWPDVDPPGRPAESFFVAEYGAQMRIRGHPVGVQLEFLEAAQGLDYAHLLQTTEALLEAIEAAIPALAGVELPTSAGPLLYAETSLGALVVGSPGPDTHDRNDAFLVLDPGGDDQWLGPAGTNVGLPSRVGLAIDLAGNDRYAADAAHAQGSGYGGLGILVDAGFGGDEYACTQQCQGAGMLGVGVLWDHGGSDVRTAEGFAQGAGTLGVGLLVDGSGDDRSVVHGRGQGFASTGGLGAHVDLLGHDQLRLGVPGEDVLGIHGGGGQGGAFGTRPYPWIGDATLHGGVGVLYDRAGNDGYYARASGQGSAELLSLGVLVDRAGNDRYVAAHRGQGVGRHLAVGVLVDGGGDDSYEGTNTVQAAALDRSAGLLWDRGAGADRYQLQPVANALPKELGGGIAWARQPHALAALVDDGGDDVYVARWDGIAFAVPPARPDRGATAVLVDAGGTDSYAVSIERPGGNAADGAVWLFADRSAGIDTVAPDAGWSRSPLAPSGGFAWSGEATSGAPLPDPDPGDPTSDDAGARWRAAEAAWRARVDDPATDAELPGWVAEAALSDRDRSVRRAAARALLASGDLDGVDVLVDSLVYQSDDNWDRVGWDTVRFQLHLLTGLDPFVGDERWRSEWRAIRDGFDLPAAFAAYAAFERARRASARRDVDAVVAECTAAVESGVETLLRPCATLVGLHAWVLGHPESHARHDPQRAVELGNLAVVWAPDQPDHFVNLGRAWLALDQPDLAERALAKAEVLDPDDPSLLALQRRLEDR